MKSCEFCDCNDRGYCVFREEKLEREMSHSCAGYRNRKSVELTTRQYDLIVDALERRVNTLLGIVSNKMVPLEQKESVKELIEELDELADYLAPISI